MIDDVYNEVSRVCEGHVKDARRKGINYKSNVKEDANILRLQEDLKFIEKY